MHALVRDTLLAGLTATKRAQLHAAIGEVLARRPGADPAAVARHLCAGASVGGAAEAVRWCLVAAKDAQERLDFSQMLDLADSGLRAVAEHDDASRPGYLQDRSLALVGAGRRAARQRGDRRSQGRLSCRQPATLGLAGDVVCMLEAALGHVGWGQASIPDPEGRALLEEVRELLPDENLADRALLDGYLAFYLHVYEQGGGGRAEALARSAVDLAAQSGEPRARFQTLLQLSHVLMAGADHAGAAAADRAARTGGDGARRRQGERCRHDPPAGTRDGADRRPRGLPPCSGGLRGHGALEPRQLRAAGDVAGHERPHGRRPALLRKLAAAADRLRRGRCQPGQLVGRPADLPPLGARSRQ